MSASEALFVGDGADFVAVFLTGVGLPLAAGAEAVVAAGAGVGVDLAAGAGVDVGAEDAGVIAFDDDEDEAFALAFLLFRDKVFVEEASAAGAAEASLDGAA